jgi:hypothetical protein
VIELTQVFRQAEQSEIILNAHLINHGQMPELRPPETGLSDFTSFSRKSRKMWWR